MTIVATVSDGSSIISIADSMISRPGNQGRMVTVLSKASKFLAFRPTIKVIGVQLGRLDYIEHRTLSEFYLSFAGNYSNISAIASEFGSILTSQLYARANADAGAKTILRSREMNAFRRGEGAFDSAEESRLPLAAFDLNEASRFLVEVLRIHCADFAGQLGEHPDVRLHLMGPEDGRLGCVEVTCTSMGEPDYGAAVFAPSVNVTASHLAPFHLAVMGNAGVCDQLRADFGPRLEKMSDLYETLGPDSLYESDQASKRRVELRNMYDTAVTPAFSSI